MNSEIWKPIKGYEGIYEISNKGRVKSLYREVRVSEYSYMVIEEHFLNGKQMKSGYIQVSLSKDGKVKQPLLHRLVAEAYIPNPHNLEAVNHKDENKQNNNVINLEWCTAKHNVNHATGPERRAEKRRKEVLQIADTGEIVETYNSIREAANATGANESHIGSCCRGKRKTAGGFIWQFARRKNLEQIIKEVEQEVSSYERT